MNNNFSYLYIHIITFSVFVCILQGAKQTAEIVQKKSKTWMAFRKIRQYDEDFVGPQFAKEAQQIYLDVHKAVAELVIKHV